jgi:hypothetical protein
MPWKLSNSLHIQEKSTKKCKSQTPLYLSNSDRLGKLFCAIFFKTLENGVDHLQIFKKKPKLGQNAHATQKPQIFYILQSLHF